MRTKIKLYFKSTKWNYSTNNTYSTSSHLCTSNNSNMVSSNGQVISVVLSFYVHRIKRGYSEPTVSRLQLGNPWHHPGGPYNDSFPLTITVCNGCSLFMSPRTNYTFSCNRAPRASPDANPPKIPTCTANFMQNDKFAANRFHNCYIQNFGKITDWFALSHQLHRLYSKEWKINIKSLIRKHVGWGECGLWKVMFSFSLQKLRADMNTSSIHLHNVHICLAKHLAT